ncbi:BsuBI/PstI family type II restriction endonuclease [Staphylococcus simulans]|uniref:BsuBI/PstI family type II restriction endonuclease n=1 Tax=Staphylococcus simulans TaxID=1286 RepID=UPI0021CF374A|nr:BsuBI/PstI family type II restriction endonuclease [Staphylococcus simulans]UXR45672.1 restriction endonuclease [Staphylococcus simulans]
MNNIEKRLFEAKEILKSIGLPRQQQNDRTALCLLALIDLKPEEDWINAKSRMIGITPIMKFCEKFYNREYKPNTRETFRRQSMHQFVSAGIALYNPDDPDRAVNSPKAVYQIEDETLRLIQNYNTDDWIVLLEKYLSNRQTLVQEYANEREQHKLPLVIEEKSEYKFSSGAHSQLIKDVIEEFGPRFVPGGKLIYAGDTGAKTEFFNENLMSELGMSIDLHGKMPDVIIYYPDKEWLIIVEAVTSHGPVDGKRYKELQNLFKDSKVGIVYVTAFPNRKLMSKYFDDIAWETEVWISNAPSHLIHFNGERFLGPY